MYFFYSTHCTNVLKVLFSLSADKNETTVFGNSIDGIRSTPKGQPKGHTMLNHLHGNEEKTKDLFFCLLIFFYVTLSKDGFFFAQGNVLVLTAAGKRTGPTAQGNVLDPQGTTGNRFL